MWIQKTIQYTVFCVSFIERFCRSFINGSIKSLDTTNHELLVTKLHACGFSIEAVKFLPTRKLAKS